MEPLLTGANHSSQWSFDIVHSVENEEYTAKTIGRCRILFYLIECVGILYAGLKNLNRQNFLENNVAITSMEQFVTYAVAFGIVNLTIEVVWRFFIRGETRPNTITIADPLSNITSLPRDCLTLLDLPIKDQLALSQTARSFFFLVRGSDSYWEKKCEQRFYLRKENESWYQTFYYKRDFFLKRSMRTVTSFNTAKERAVVFIRGVIPNDGHPFCIERNLSETHSIKKISTYDASEINPRPYPEGMEPIFVTSNELFVRDAKGALLIINLVSLEVIPKVHSPCKNPEFTAVQGSIFSMEHSNPPSSTIFRLESDNATWSEYKCFSHVVHFCHNFQGHELIIEDKGKLICYDLESSEKKEITLPGYALFPNDRLCILGTCLLARFYNKEVELWDLRKNTLQMSVEAPEPVQALDLRNNNLIMCTEKHMLVTGMVEDTAGL